MVMARVRLGVTYFKSIAILVILFSCVYKTALKTSARDKQKVGSVITSVYNASFQKQRKTFIIYCFTANNKLM